MRCDCDKLNLLSGRWVFCAPQGEEEMRRFDRGLHSLFNLNCPEDLDRAREILELRAASPALRAARKAKR